MNRNQAMKTKKAIAAKSRIEKLKKVARELGYDKNEPAFNAKLKVVAGQKPEPE